MKMIDFQYEDNFLVYNKFTAGYKQMEIEGKNTLELTITFSPVPRSVFTQTTLMYEETDLNTERVSNLIFSKEFKYLETIETNLKGQLRLKTNLGYKLEFHAYGTLPCYEVKARRFKDLRKKGFLPS